MRRHNDEAFSNAMQDLLTIREKAYKRGDMATCQAADRVMDSIDYLGESIERLEGNIKSLEDYKRSLEMKDDRRDRRITKLKDWVDYQADYIKDLRSGNVPDDEWDDAQEDEDDDQDDYLALFRG